MSFFGLKTAAGILAAQSRTVRRVAAKQVQRGNRGFLPSIFAQAGRQAKKAKR